MNINFQKYIELTILSDLEKRKLNEFMQLNNNKVLIINIIKSLFYEINNKNILLDLNTAIFMFIFKSDFVIKNKHDLEQQIMKFKTSIIILSKTILNDMLIK